MLFICLTSITSLICLLSQFIFCHRYNQYFLVKSKLRQVFHEFNYCLFIFQSWVSELCIQFLCTHPYSPSFQGLKGVFYALPDTTKSMGELYLFYSFLSYPLQHLPSVWKRTLRTLSSICFASTKSPLFAPPKLCSWWIYLIAS